MCASSLLPSRGPRVGPTSSCGAMGLLAAFLGKTKPDGTDDAKRTPSQGNTGKSDGSGTRTVVLHGQDAQRRLESSGRCSIARFKAHKLQNDGSRFPNPRAGRS